MYQTLKKDQEGLYRGACPTCGTGVEVTENLEVQRSCSHLRRRWRVTADRRVRVEFHTPAPAGATPRAEV